MSLSKITNFHSDLQTKEPESTFNVDSITIKTTFKFLVPYSSELIDKIRNFRGNSREWNIRDYQLISVDSKSNWAQMHRAQRSYNNTNTSNIRSIGGTHIPQLFHVKELDFQFRRKSSVDKPCKRAAYKKGPELILDHKDHRPKEHYRFYVQAIHPVDKQGHFYLEFSMQTKTNISRFMRKEFLECGLYDESKDGLRLANNSNNYISSSGFSDRSHFGLHIDYQALLLDELGERSEEEMLSVLQELGITNIGRSLVHDTVKIGSGEKRKLVHDLSKGTGPTINLRFFSQSIHKLELNWNMKVGNVHDAFDNTLDVVKGFSPDESHEKTKKGGKAVHYYLHESHKSIYPDEIKMYTKDSHLLRIELMTNSSRINNILQRNGSQLSGMNMAPYQNINDQYYLVYKHGAKLSDMIDYIFQVYKKHHLQRFFDLFISALNAKPILSPIMTIPRCDPDKLSSALKYLMSIRSGSENQKRVNLALNILKSSGHINGLREKPKDSVIAGMRKIELLNPKGHNQKFALPSHMKPILDNLYTLKVLPLK